MTNESPSQQSNDDYIPDGDWTQITDYELKIVINPGDITWNQEFTVNPWISCCNGFSNDEIDRHHKKVYDDGIRNELLERASGRYKKKEEPRPIHYEQETESQIEDADCVIHDEAKLDELTSAINAERLFRNPYAEKLDSVPDGSSMASAYGAIEKIYQGIRPDTFESYVECAKSNDDVNLDNIAEFIITWYDVRDLASEGIYTFKQSDDGYVEAEQKCDDREKLDKLKKCRIHRFVFTSFDKLSKFMDDAFIRIEYFIQSTRGLSSRILMSN